jgi:hypothetical protein
MELALMISEIRVYVPAIGRPHVGVVIPSIQDPGSLSVGVTEPLEMTTRVPLHRLGAFVGRLDPIGDLTVTVTTASGRIQSMPSREFTRKWPE